MSSHKVSKSLQEPKNAFPTISHKYIKNVVSKYAKKSKYGAQKSVER